MNKTPNNSIKCSVNSCAYHCGEQNYCTLNEIKVVCTLGTTPPQAAASPPPNGGIALHEGHHSPLVRASRPPNGGIGIIRGVTRRRHADSQPLMLQNPHRHRTMWGHEGPKSLSVGLWVAACIGKPDRNRRSG